MKSKRTVFITSQLNCSVLFFLLLPCHGTNWKAHQKGTLHSTFPPVSPSFQSKTIELSSYLFLLSFMFAVFWWRQEGSYLLVINNVPFFVLHRWTKAKMSNILNMYGLIYILMDSYRQLCYTWCCVMLIECGLKS